MAQVLILVNFETTQEADVCVTTFHDNSITFLFQAKHAMISIWISTFCGTLEAFIFSLSIWWIAFIVKGKFNSLSITTF